MKNTEKNEQATYLCQIRDSRQFDMIPTGVRKFINENSDLKMEDKYLYLNVLWPEAQRNDDFIARTSYDNLQAVVGKSHSTIQRMLKRLEDAGLIWRVLETYGQKTYLRKIIVRLPHKALEKILIHGKQRKSAVVSKLLSTSKSDRSPPSKNERHVTRSVRGSQKEQLTTYRADETDTYSKIAKESLHNTVEVVFDKKQEERIRDKLQDMSYSGKAGERLIAEIAFSVRGGQWTCSSSDAVHVILNRIKTNEWRTPFYFESAPGAEVYVFSQDKQVKAA